MHQISRMEENKIKIATPYLKVFRQSKTNIYSGPASCYFAKDEMQNKLLLVDGLRLKGCFRCQFKKPLLSYSMQFQAFWCNFWLSISFNCISTCSMIVVIRRLIHGVWIWVSKIQYSIFESRQFQSVSAKLRDWGSLHLPQSEASDNSFLCQHSQNQILGK